MLALLVHRSVIMDVAGCEGNDAVGNKDAATLWIGNKRLVELVLCASRTGVSGPGVGQAARSRGKGGLWSACLCALQKRRKEVRLHVE